ALVVSRGWTLILNSFGAEPASTLAVKSGTDDITSNFLMAAALFAFAVMIFGLGSSPFCQKTSAGWISSNGVITALRVSTIVECAGSGSSVWTVTVLTCVPVRPPMLKVAVISPFSPGATCSFCVCAVVQPQEAWTDVKWTGVLPTFSYLKCATACLSPSAGCKSTEVCSHFSSARAPWASAVNATIPINLKKFILISLKRGRQYIQQPHRANGGVLLR